MKNECSLVRDMLPLYLEDMVSDKTQAFIKEYLTTCIECVAEFEALKSETKV